MWLPQASGQHVGKSERPVACLGMFQVSSRYEQDRLQIDLSGNEFAPANCQSH